MGRKSTIERILILGPQDTVDLPRREMRMQGGKRVGWLLGLLVFVLGRGGGEGGDRLDAGAKRDMQSCPRVSRPGSVCKDPVLVDGMACMYAVMHACKARHLCGWTCLRGERTNTSV